MLAKKYVGDKVEMLASILVIVVTKIFYTLMVVAGQNISRSFTNMFFHQGPPNLLFGLFDLFDFLAVRQCVKNFLFDAQSVWSEQSKREHLLFGGP